MKKIKIQLTQKDVSFLKVYKRKKGRTLRQTNRANILLLCHKGKSEKSISEFLDVAANTIWRVKKKYLEKDLHEALSEEPRSGRPALFNTYHESELTALACSDAPEGRERWTLELLTEKMRSKTNGCRKISKETVRLMLKKMELSPG